MKISWCMIAANGDDMVVGDADATRGVGQLASEVKIADDEATMGNLPRCNRCE
jgi:hypothetical protein